MMEKLKKAYQEQSNHYLAQKLMELNIQHDELLDKYENEKVARILWKLATVAMAAFYVGQWLGEKF